jgi:hypothetical protein
MGLARDLHAHLYRDLPFLCGGILEMGVDPCPDPGSRAFSYSAVAHAVKLACETLCDIGARRIVVMTFHGSPLHEHAIEVGCRAARARGARALNPMNLLMDVLVNVDGHRFAPAVDHIEDAAERKQLLDAIATDFHGGFFETLHYAPESVSPRHVDLAPCPPVPRDPLLARMERAARRLGRTRVADELLLAARSQGWGTIRPFPGYTSAPHRASAQAGAYFASQILELYGDRVRAALDGAADAPPPIMSWVLWGTLFGRRDAARKLELHEVAQS